MKKAGKKMKLLRDHVPAADFNRCLACFKLKKNAPNGHYYLPRAATPDQITQQNSLQREGGH
jgi:hypothetical protein